MEGLATCDGDVRCLGWKEEFPTDVRRAKSRLTNKSPVGSNNRRPDGIGGFCLSASS